MSQQTRLLIISGLSGSGKSVALHVLEDLGYYCIDNMPAALLKSLINEITKQQNVTETQVAVGVDARNPKASLQALPALIEDLRDDNIRTELLFLQASDDILLKRYAESRRRHPLASEGSALRAAIQRERDLLSPVINAADLVIDTSRSSVYELADAIRDRVDRRDVNSLSVLVESFVFKHGIPPDADFVFDLRCLPNPYWEPTLRSKTGLEPEVVSFLDQKHLFLDLYRDILGFLTRWIPEYVSLDRSYLTIGIGCTGGQHRSVYMTEKLVAALRQIHEPVLVRHNELPASTGISDYSG
jgi:UPF0042 nucleotide-binding protein